MKNLVHKITQHTQDILGFEYKAFFDQQNKMTKWLKQMREALENVNNCQYNSTYIYSKMED